MLIPLLEEEDALEAILSRLDGLLLPGGADVDPRRYGEAAIPGLGEVRVEADRVELHLVRAAARRALPVFGICRGIQVLSVAMGGSLYQDLRHQQVTTVDHTGSRPVGRDHLVHPVRIDPSSELAKLVGATQIEVNSLHHQGIKTVAPRLRAVAWSPDGVIEGVEGEQGFLVAVQWHPEELQAQPWGRRLFEGFVSACAQRVAR